MATRCDNGKFSKANRLRSNANLHRGPSSLNTLDRTENEDIIEWKNGRRIVELGKLAEGLGCCSDDGCDRLQDLRRTISEKRYGFGSLLWIQCECGVINKIYTGTYHNPMESRGVRVLYFALHDPGRGGPWGFQF